MRSPRRLLVTVLGTALLAVAALPVGAGAATAPVVKVRPVVSGFSVTVGYSIDRPASAIAKQICWLRDPKRVLTKVACDRTPEPSSTATLTKFRRTLPVTKAGTNAFLVRFTLTDGRQVLGGRSFTIEPGPAVRFSVTGLYNTSLLCSDGLASCDTDPHPMQIALVKARDQHGNLARGYNGTVTFNAGVEKPARWPNVGTLVSEAKARNGILRVAVDPFYLPSFYDADCSAFMPWARLRVADKADPSIKGCQDITAQLSFAIPAPLWSSVTIPGCEDGCYEEPTGTVTVDTTSQPVQVAEVKPGNQIMVVGKTTEGQFFLQQIDLGNVTVKLENLSSVSQEKCGGCPPESTLAAELTVGSYPPGDFTPTLGASPPPGSEDYHQFLLNKMKIGDPVTGKTAEAEVSANASDVVLPTCHNTIADAFAATNAVTCVAR